MENIRNIAIIAHVDHGKTTLVDKILHHCQLFRENESKGDLILDNNDLERERGITILSKNVSVPFKGNKINIIDTASNPDITTGTMLGKNARIHGTENKIVNHSSFHELLALLAWMFSQLLSCLITSSLRSCTAFFSSALRCR